MAISDAVQTLSAAFAFGILLQATAGALFIYYRGHGSTIFQNGRRLVLILFLLFAALWAQIQFLNLLLSDTMVTTCQATLIISTIFDQLARVGIEQFLLWSVGHGTKLTAERLILQGILLVRIVGGGVLVGFTRPQFKTVCVAQTELTPLAVVVLAVDAIIIGVLMVRAMSLGMFREMREKSSGTRQEQSKALIFTITGLAVWTGTSVPMILGIPTIILMVRTVLPASGLFILIGVVTMFPGALLQAREENGTTPEARSPFVTPTPPRELFGENVRSNGSPVSTTNTYAKNGILFVVNPSTPHDSITTMFQSSSRGDMGGFTKLGNQIDVREIDDTPPERPDRLGVRDPGHRGSSGVFPSMVATAQTGVQAALAPQIRPNVPPKPQNSTTFPAPAAQQKRSMFNWGKSEPEKPSIRTLTISNPVSLDVSGGGPQPFAKMHTIDLATAASTQRERREEASARLKLVVNRPAPQPPQFSTQEALRRSISVKRKKMLSLPVEAMPTIPASSVSGISRVTINGTTSSASLSPGRDEVRRRSPRQTNSFDQTFSETAMQPTLQRKRSVGIPSDPRATRITMAHEAKVSQPQTVVLMNDVVYDNPALVNTIIQDAPGIYAAAQKTRDVQKSAFSVTTASLKSSNWVIHRPRPYRRDKHEDRAIFPSEPYPGHRRSKSGSSITPRTYLLMSQPGSPTQLPQLPPLPPPPITTAVGLKRLLSNDMKSMTFDEKVELLFPDPPGPITMRRSSVPSLPRLPSVFMSETPMIQSPTEEQPQSRRASKCTTMASFAIPETNVRPRSPKKQTTHPEESQGYRCSANTYRTIADEVGETWVPGISAENVSTRNSLMKAPERQSVVDDMRKSYSTEASDESFQDDATTYWESVHSEVPPVDLTKARQNANSLYIQPPDARQQRASTQSIPAMPDLDFRRCEAFVPLMLDAEVQRVSFLLSGADDNRMSFLLDADQSLPGDKTPQYAKNEYGWHHRIGDELPTFSERSHARSHSGGRKMPPPTPLLLSRTGKKATVVVRPSEISPPTDSPHRAMADLQAQLEHFEEEPHRGSVGSLLRHMPGHETAGAPDTGRFRVLEDLEKEMGQQETHWQEMQTNLDRDSISQAMSSYTQAQSEESEGTLTRESSQRSNRTPSKIMSRRARVRSSMTVSEHSTTPTQSSDNSRASIWQQRLAEAQMEYMENAPALLRKKSLNFLSVLKGQAPMMSPTPPESDASETDIETELDSDSDTEAMMKYQAPKAQFTEKSKAELWQPSLPSPKAASERLWNFPYETASTKSSVEPPARNVRPAQRRLENQLSISSTELWTKPRSSKHSRPVVGLWSSKPVRPRSITTRPLTQRPQRKTRRITFLPDIVESPVPLPNKRETLGIFQFPWGEKSDQPTYQPAFNPVMLAGPVGPALAPSLDARSKQLEPDQPEYSSSFFDDYEEEDEDLDTESDDDFDETTLWEIANLLNSRDVPSKDSLLPPPRNIVDDYDMGSDPESPDSAGPHPVSRLPIQPLAMTSRSVAQLWAGDASPPMGNVAPGLPQPESDVWGALIPAKDDIVRSKARSASAILTLVSTDLWTAPEAESSPIQSSFMWSGDTAADESPMSTSTSTPEVTSPALMWSPKFDASDERSSGMFTIPSEVIRSTDASSAAIKMAKAARPSVGGAPAISSKNLWTRLQDMEEASSWISNSSSPRFVLQKNSSPRMWAPTPKASDVIVLGLFDASTPRSNYRSTEAMPAAMNMICKPRTSLKPLSKVKSNKLWRNGQCKLPIERHWVSESSTRPESPSYSTASSVASSPISDSSSVKSTSTKASSIWSASISANPTWWDRKAKKSPAPSPVDDSKHPSKIPVCQAPTPLVPVRESRVLASRELWDSRAPVLENTPVKTRRGTLVQPSAIPVLKAASSQYSRPVALRDDWANALAEAVAAGTVKIVRKVASEADWNAALSEALAKSELRLQRPAYSVAKWDAAVDEAIYASIVKPSYDASVLHPVSFTSSLISNVSDVHPAAMSYFKQKSGQSMMWRPLSATSTPKKAMLWSKDNVTPRTVAVEMRLSGELVRKATVAKAMELPALKSTSMWVPSQIAATERNWMITTFNKTSAQTWMPSIVSQVVEAQSTSMWTPKSASSKSTPELFAHAKGNHIKPTSSLRPVTLPHLNSNELFDISATATPKPTHWLHETSTPITVSKSMTWTAPTTPLIVPTTQQSIMWQAPTLATTTSQKLFTNPHSQPWSRTKRSAESLTVNAIESTDLWRPPMDMPESPKNWLVKRRIRESSLGIECHEGWRSGA